jgi:hypothetical protein
LQQRDTADFREAILPGGGAIWNAPGEPYWKAPH